MSETISKSQNDQPNVKENKTDDTSVMDKKDVSNGKNDVSSEENEKPKLSDEELVTKIKELLEFYFSDANLSRDKFLVTQMDKNDGYVDLSVFLKFNKIKSLSEDLNIIIAAAKQCTSLELKDDNKHAKRITPFDKNSGKEAPKRSLFLNGVPKDATIDQIKDCFDQLSGKANGVTYVQIRRDAKTKKPLGSVFVEFISEDLANDILTKTDSISIKDTVPSKVILMSDWLSSRKKKNSEEKQISDESKNEEEEVEVVKGCIVSVISVGTECSREVIKEALGDTKDHVAYIDYSKGEESAKIRFTDPENAVKSVGILSNADLGGTVPKEVKLLEGEEEDNYWKAYIEKKQEFVAKQKKSKKRPRNNSGYFKNMKKSKKDE